MSKSTKRLAMTSELDGNSPNRGQNSKSKTIGHKKELVEAVRNSNPAALNAAPSIFWQVEGNLKTTTIDDSGVSQQLNIVENGVNYSAKRFNDLKVANIRATHELKHKLDELELQKKAWEDLDAMKRAETDEGKRIVQLQRDIGTVEYEIARKEHYTRQLEFVLQRLRRNQIKFDAHMNGMEEALRGIEKEAREVKLLRRGLDSGLARAQHVEEETRKRLGMANKERSVLLENRKSEMKNAEMLQVWLMNRDQAKADLATALRGDLSKDEEMLLINQLREKQDRTRNLQKANEESHKLLQQMEDEFMLIKQVTGVSSLDEMLDKVMSQKPNKANLEQEVKEAEQKQIAAKKATLELENQFQDLKSSGVGVADVSREITNKMEAEISAARQEFKITHALSERLNGVLVGLQQGGNGLQQRVQPYIHMADSSVFELTQQDGGDESVWAETMEALASAEQVLAKMMELCSGGDTSPSKGINGLMGDSEADGDDDSQAPREGVGALDGRGTMDSFDSAGPCFANNVRVVSKKAIRDQEYGAEIEDAYESTNLGVTDITGDAALATAAGNAPVPAGGDGAGDEDTEGGNLSPGAPGGVGGSPTGAAAAGAGGGAAGEEEGGDVIPTRVALKKQATKSTQEAIRRKDMEQRRKRLAEKMRNGEIDHTGMGNAARLRSQVESASRLSTIYHPPTLPEGVTLRDDPMTKTKAFLTHLPDLI